MKFNCLPTSIGQGSRRLRAVPMLKVAAKSARNLLSIFGVTLLASCGGSGPPTTAAPTLAAVTPAGSAPVTAPPTMVISDGTAYGDLRATGAKLLLHQRGALAITPANFASRLVTMDATLSAYNGAFLRLPATSGLISKNAAVSLAAIASDLAPMAALRPTNLKLNFAIVEWQRDLDPFDDWSVVIANFATLAKAASAAGLVGIVIDNESRTITDDGTTGLRVNYPSDVRYASAHSVYDYRARTELISKQIMQAMLAEFPRLAVVVLRGPAASDFYTPPLLTPPLGAGQPALLGSFFAGFIAAKTDAALVVDGGNDYGLRSNEEFAASTSWRKNGLASATNSVFMPMELRATWPATVSASFGVREIDGYYAQTIASAIPVWENTLTNALRNADNLAWTSFDTVDLASADATNAFVLAAARAKAGALPGASRFLTTPLGSGTGLLVEYFDTMDRTFLLQTRVDPFVDASWGGSGPPGSVISRGDDYSAIWSGFVEAPVTGTYVFYGSTDDGMRVTLEGVVLVNALVIQGDTEYSASVQLTAGQRYRIKVEWFQHNGGAEAHVSWQPPGGAKAVIPTARLYPWN